MSVRGYIWDVAEPTDEAVAVISDFPPLVTRILRQRGISKADEIAHLLRPDYDMHLHDPFLFRHMRAVVERLDQAITNGEHVMIHGDYDADGVTATAALVEALRAFGVDPAWTIPDRFSEGYGLQRKSVEKYASDHVRLLITVDCGTSNHEEIALAHKLGMDVIILDHHHGHVEPNQALIINSSLPNEEYPFRGFSSGGIVFTVIRGMIKAGIRTRSGAPLKPGWEKWLLDLVAISVVADLMPLRGENRVFVARGLQVLRRTRRPGLQEMLRRIGAHDQTITEQTIGFQIAPRLNAVGRLRHASAAVRLLLTKNETEATELVNELEAVNADRQRLTTAATEEAILQIGKQPTDDPAHVVYAQHWSPGVLGLVAGRLVDRFWKPIVVMTEVEGRIVGSVRATEGLNLMEIMPAGVEFFERFGGHPGASGFTLKPGVQDNFREWFVQYLRRDVPVHAPRVLRIDGRARVPELNDTALDAIEMLAPFGVDHHRPIFLLEGVRCTDIRFVGNERQHAKLSIEQDGNASRVIGFRFAQLLNELRVGSATDLVVEPTWNVWNGRREIQLRLIDLRIV